MVSPPIAPPRQDWIILYKDAVTWPELAYVLGARSVGYVGPRYSVIPFSTTMMRAMSWLIFTQEPGGSITLGRDHPLGGARGRSAAPLTIVDNDVQHRARLSSPTFSVSEASPPPDQLIRTNGSVAPFKSLLHAQRNGHRPRLHGRTNTLTSTRSHNLHFTFDYHDTLVESTRPS